LPDEPAAKNKITTTMKNDIKKTGNGHKTATAQLADLNRQIEDLKLQKTALAEPMKQRHAELRTEILQVETEILELDSNWRPEPMKPKAEKVITEILTGNGKPMAVEEIIQAVGGAFTPWKVKNTLKKKSNGAKATFLFADGKYTIRAAA
jgi:hypothetical protein